MGVVHHAKFANSAWNVAAGGWNEFRPDDPNPMPTSPFLLPGKGWPGVFP
jgi:hypothetical protein